MKKLGPIILGFILGALLTFYFCPRQDTETKIVKPKGVISVKKAKKLNNNWSKFRKPVVDSITERLVGKKDFRWAEWSVEDINNYITYAQNKADSLGYTMTGLKAYLGVYGEKEAKDKRCLTTIFLVPTGHKVKPHAEASALNFSFEEEDNLPIPPMNEGTGGQGGYP